MSMRDTYDKFVLRSRQVWIRDSDDPADVASMPDFKETMWALAATVIGIVGIFTLVVAWISLSGYN